MLKILQRMIFSATLALWLNVAAARADVWRCNGNRYTTAPLTAGECTPLQSSTTCGIGEKYFTPPRDNIPIKVSSCPAAAPQRSGSVRQISPGKEALPLANSARRACSRPSKTDSSMENIQRAGNILLEVSKALSSE